MPAPKGNEYYLLRSKDGRDTEYSPESLLEVANQYFQWVLDNPLMEEQIVKYKDNYERVSLPKMRPFTIQGLCNFAEIAEKTFWNYEQREEFLQVTSRIRSIIENHQFEGAASGFLNPNIIARKLGLADNSNLNVKTEQPLFGNE